MKTRFKIPWLQSDWLWWSCQPSKTCRLHILHYCQLISFINWWLLVSICCMSEAGDSVMYKSDFQMHWKVYISVINVRRVVQNHAVCNNHTSTLSHGEHIHGLCLLLGDLHRRLLVFRLLSLLSNPWQHVLGRSSHDATEPRNRLMVQGIPVARFSSFFFLPY